MRKYRHYLIYLILFCSIYSLQVLHILYKYRNIDAGKKIRLVFTVSDLSYSNRSNYIIRFDNFRIVLPSDTKVELGDKIEVIGTVEDRVIGVIFPEYTLKYPSILYINKMSISGSLSDFLMYKTRTKIDEFKGLLLQNIEKVLPDPQAGLLAGMLLGSKVGLSSEFYDGLVASGTLHVVAASGFNISIVASTVMLLLSKSLNKRTTVCLSLVVVWFYAILAGLEPSIVRAALMFTLGSVALIYGRDYSVNWSLLSSAMLMLILNPFLIESIGFWLSVSSTWGVLSLSSGFVKLFDAVVLDRKTFFGKIYFLTLGFIKTDLATTLAAQLATLPLIVVVFARFSVVAPLVNILVLWVIPIVMFLGALVVVFSLLFPPLSYFLGYLAWFPLTYFVKVVLYFGDLPFSTFILFEPTERGLSKQSFVYVLGCYVFMLITIKLANRVYLRMHK